MGSHLNWVSQNKTEQQFDGDGRSVVEKRGHRGYPNVSPPSGPLTTSPYLFQIWSSVLGKSLTTVTPAGNKLETNVFAGGAVIAKQGRYVENNTNYDSINWTTVEPVTGGTEPLGQTILASDPATLPDPQYNQAFIGYASDAEWQCTGPTYDSFSAMPFHCQKRMIMDLSYSLADLFGFTQKQNSPIAVVDSPIPSFDFNDSPSENVLAYGRTSTSKPDKKKGTNPKGQGKEDCPKNRDGTYRTPCVSAPSIPEDLSKRLGANQSQDDPAHIEALLRELAGPSALDLGPTWESMIVDARAIAGLTLQPSEKVLDESIHCNEKVWEKLKELIGIWNRTRTDRNSNRIGFERVFSVEKVNGQIAVSDITTTYNEFSFSIDASTGVIAVFHTHPFEPFPSGKVSERTFDVGQALRKDFVSYVYGPSGLTLFNPRNSTNAMGKDRKIATANCPK